MRRNELDINSQLVRNIITNPAFVRVQSGNDVMLTNWAANGSFNGATSYHSWIGGNQAQWASTGIATDKSHSDTRSFKLTNCTVAGQASLKALTSSTTALKVLKGSTVSWSFWVFSTVAGTIFPYWEGSKVADGSYTGGNGAASATPVPANTWTYITGTNIIYTDSYLQGAGGYSLNVGLGDSVWFDDFCITTSEEPYPYFDGSTPAADGYTYAWTGTPNSSASVRTALAAVNRVNLFTNPSFEASNRTNNVRTNLATNPSFETAAGTVEVRKNLISNPSMEATNSTVAVRTNLATNPSFEETSGTANVRTNLITNPSFEATNGTITVRTNLATNPSFETAAGTAVARRNLATNSGFETASGTVNVRTNLLANPSMETASGTVNVRTNLCTNPSLETGPTSWATNLGNGGAVATSVQTDGGMFGANYYRALWTTANTSSGYVEYAGLSNGGLTAGQTYTFSAYVRSSVSTTMFVRASWSNAGIYTSGVTGPNFEVPANVWTRVSFTTTVPAGSNGAWINWNSTTSQSLNQTIDIDGALIEQTAVLEPYFDGTVQAAQRVNLSRNPSPATAGGWPITYGVNGNGTTTFGPVSGLPSSNGATVTFTAAPTDAWNVQMSDIASIIGGQPLTASMYGKPSWAGATACLTFEFRSATGASLGYYGTPQVATPANTVTRISQTITAPAAATSVAIFWDAQGAGNAMPPVNATFVAGAALVEQSATLGDYFDGGTVATSSAGFAWSGAANASTSYQYDKDFAYAWSGTANASSSYQQAPGVLGASPNGKSVTWQSGNKSLFGPKSIASKSSGMDIYSGVIAGAGSLAANTKYTFSAWVYMPTLYGQGLKAVVTGGGMGVIQGTLVTTVGAWARVSLTFTTLDTTAVAVYVITSNTDTPPAGQVFYTDGWLLEESSLLREYFDGANPIKNLISNPDMATDTAGWSLYGGVVRDASGWVLTKPALKLSRVASSVPLAVSEKFPVFTGSVLSVSALGSVTNGASLSIDFEYYTASGAYLGTSPRNYLTSTGATRWGVTAATPDSATMAIVRFYMDANGDGYGYATDVLVEYGSSQNPYYKGAGDYTYAWTGTPNASTSVQQAPGVAGVDLNTPGSSRAHQSVRESLYGSKSVRILKDGVYSYLNFYLSGLDQNSTYTVSVYAKSPNATKVNWVDRGPTNSNFWPMSFPIGTAYSRFSRTFATGASETTRTLSFGVETADVPDGSEFFVDALLVEESPTLLPYFDGSHPIQNLANNPDAAVDLTGWISGGTMSRVFEDGRWWVVAPGGNTYTYANMSLHVNRYYAASIRVKGPVGATFTTASTDNVYGGFTSTGSYTIPASGEIVITEKSNNYSRGIGGYFGIYTTGGAPLKLTEAYCELVDGTGVSVTSPYYKGLGDFSYSWTGTPDASVSIQSGVALPTVSGAAAAVVQSTMWNGHSKSARLIPQYKTPGSSYTDIAGIAWQTGVTYTASLTYYMPQAQTVAGTAGPVLIAYWYLNGVYRQAVMPQPQQTSATPSEGRLVSVTWSFPAGATDMNLRFRADSQMGDSDVWFDNLLVEEAGSVSPYFDGSNPLTNLATNPSLETDAAGWLHWQGMSGSAVGTRETSGGANGMAFFRTRWTSSQTSASRGGIYITVPANAGQPYSASISVRPSKIQSLALNYEWLDSGKNQIGAEVLGPSTTVPANVWTTLKNENKVSPVGAAFVRITVYSSNTGTAWEVNDTLDGDSLLLEGSTTVTPDFYTNKGDFTYTWSGVPHASMSLQQAPWVIGAGWNDRWYGNTGGSGLVYQAKGGISGTYARKLWKTASTGSIADTGLNPDAWIPVSSGWNYTLSAWVRSSVDQYFNFYIGWKDAANLDIGSTPLNSGVFVPANKWTRLSITATAPANAATGIPVIGPYGGALPMPAGGTLDFDNVLFERTTSMLPYFDGATPERINRLHGIEFSALQPEGISSSYAWGGDTWQKLDNSIPTTFRAWSSKSYFPDGVLIDASVEVANPTGSTVYFTLDLGDSGVLVNVPVNPYSRLRVATSAETRGDNLAFLDITPNQTLLVRKPFMEIRQGSVAAPYFDGASDSDFAYTWSGTANASISYQQAPTYADSPSLWNDNEIFRISKPLQVGTAAARVFWRSAGTLLRSFPVAAVTASKTVTLSVYVRPSVTMSNVRMVANTYTDVAGSTGVVNAPAAAYTSCPAGVVTRISQTFVVPAGAVSVRPILNVEQSIAGGEYIDVDGLLIEEESTVNTYFDGSNPIINLAPNSSFEVDTSGWGANTGAPTISSSTEFAKVGGRSMKASTTIPSDDCAVTFNATLAPNTTYTMSWYVFSREARTNCFVDVAVGQYNASSSSTPVSIAATTWTRISYTFTTGSALSNPAAIYLHHKGGPTTVGSTLFIDAVLLERASTANPYYSGTGDFTTLWTGAANSSTSVQQAPNVAGNFGRNNAGSVAWSSSSYSLYGGKSFASRSLGGGSNYNGVNTTVTGLTPNQAYTFSAWVYMPTSLYGLGVRAVSNGGGLGVIEGSIHNTVGSWGRVSVTFTPTNTSAVYLYVITGGGDAPEAGPVFYTDGWLLEASPAVLPYFDGTNQLRNLCLNGSFDTDISGWNGMSGVLSRDTSKSYSGSASMKVDTTSMGAYAGAVYYPTVQLNKTYTVSARVWVPTGTFINFACDNLSAAPQSITGNSAWQLISMTGWSTAPGFPVYLRSLAANQSPFWVDEVLIEESSTVSPFYSGTGDYTYYWEGAPDASASVQQAVGVAGITSSAPAYQSSGFGGTGSKSIRITPTGISPDSYVSVGGDTQGMRLGMAAGGTYTVSATGRLDRPMDSTFDRYRRIMVFYNAGAGYQSVRSDTLPNVAGSARVSLSFTLPAGTTEAFIRLYNGASAGGGDIWWDDFVLEEYITDGSYFDGSTPASGDFTFAWSGVANASTSYQQAPMVSGTDEVTVLAKAYQSKTVGITEAGMKSIRITPTSSSNGDSFAELGPMVAPALKPNTTYTIAGDRTIIAPQTNIAGTRAYRMNIGGVEQGYTLVQPVSNTAGTQRVVAHFTTPASGAVAFIRVYNGSQALGGDVWWDNIILEEGWTDGSYFDGSTSSKDGSFQKWDGAVNASTSSQYSAILGGYMPEPNIVISKLPSGGVRVVNKAGTSHSFQTLADMQAGRTYTALFRARSYKGASVRVYGLSGNPAVALTSSYQWYRVSGASYNSSRLFLSTEGGIPGAGFDISHMMIAEGVYLGNYVDGSTPFAKWDGSGNASTSVGYPPTTPIA